MAWIRLIALLTLPGALTGCVLAPFFMEKDGGDDTAPWWLEPDDTSAPTDPTDPQPRSFDPYAVFMGAQGAYNGETMDGYYLFPNDETSWQEPYITVMFVEQEYFNNYNGAYACTWTGDMDIVQPVELGEPSLWNAWEVQLTLITTDCENFEPAVWGSDTPTAKLENIRLAVGYGPMSNEMRTSFQQAVQSWGEDWNEYRPYTFSTWFGFQDGFGGWDAAEVDFSFAYELAPEGGMVYGSGGENVMVNLEETNPPPIGLYASEAWMGFYANVISGS